MSDVTALVERLIASGTNPALAAVVVTEAFVAGAISVKSGGIPLDRVTEKRRADDRARKARQRNSARLSAGNPRNEEAALSSSSSLTESESPKEVKKEREKPNRGLPLPPDFIPSPEHYAFAITAGFDRGLVDKKAEDMRVWALANAHSPKARKADWNCTFMVWLRRHAEEKKSNDQRTYARAAGGPDAIIAAAARQSRAIDRDCLLGGSNSATPSAWGRDAD